MHGEYKVPGGKLVAVDLDVVDGLLTGVSVSGDFFLEPDEALQVLSSALDGLPRDAPVSRLAAAVDDALAREQQAVTHGRVRRARRGGGGAAGARLLHRRGATTRSS